MKKQTKKEIRDNIIKILNSIDKKDRQQFDKVVSNMMRTIEVNQLPSGQYRGYIPKEQILKLDEWEKLQNVYLIALDTLY